MRSRIATVLTTLVLVAGTGAAIAVGSSTSSGGLQGGAATAQYKPGKGCGDKNHQHSGPSSKSKNQPCPVHKHSVKGKRVHRKVRHARKHHHHLGSYHCPYRRQGRIPISSCRFF